MHKACTWALIDFLLFSHLENSLLFSHIFMLVYSQNTSLITLLYILCNGWEWKWSYMCVQRCISVQLCKARLVHVLWICCLCSMLKTFNCFCRPPKSNRVPWWIFFYSTQSWVSFGFVHLKDELYKDCFLQCFCNRYCHFCSFLCFSAYYEFNCAKD